MGENISSGIFESALFISHAHKDKPRIWPILRQLYGNGLSLWVDSFEMRPGDRLTNRISRGITGAKYVAVMISENSIKSDWVEKEINLGLEQEIDGETVKIIPCLLDDCPIPLPIRDKFYCDFRGNNSVGIRDLLGAISREYSIIRVSLDTDNPLLLKRDELDEELTRAFCFTKDDVKFNFVFDHELLLNELEMIWKDDIIDTLGPQNNLEDFSNKGRQSNRRIAPYTLTNFSSGLNLVAAEVQNSLGRHALIVDEIINAIQRSTMFILHDFWRLIFSSASPDKLSVITAVNVDKTKDVINKINSLPSKVNFVPAPVIEQFVFKCSDDLIDIGIEGNRGISGARFYVPVSSIPTDTMEYLKHRISMQPQTEIPEYSWIKYFVPQIIRKHVRFYSQNGKYLSHYLDHISLDIKDYRHLGFS